MSENKDKPSKRHEFDGIKELDNDMPAWWIQLFRITIAFGVVYLVWYHVPGMPGKSLEEEYKDAQQAIESEANEKGHTSSNEGPAFDYKAALGDVALLARAKETYMATCMPCHGASGEGGIGPNLTDDYYLHGNSFANMTKTMSEGVLDKGMPEWDEVLGAEKIRELVVYIRSLHGTNPPNPKAPQGDKLELAPESE